MRELIDVSAMMNAHEQSLNEVHQLIGRGEAIVCATVPALDLLIECMRRLMLWIDTRMP